MTQGANNSLLSKLSLLYCFGPLLTKSVLSVTRLPFSHVPLHSFLQGFFQSLTSTSLSSTAQPLPPPQFCAQLQQIHYSLNHSTVASPNGKLSCLFPWSHSLRRCSTTSSATSSATLRQPITLKSCASNKAFHALGKSYLSGNAWVKFRITTILSSATRRPLECVHFLSKIYESPSCQQPSRLIFAFRILSVPSPRFQQPASDYNLNWFSYKCAFIYSVGPDCRCTGLFALHLPARLDVLRSRSLSGYTPNATRYTHTI